MFVIISELGTRQFFSVATTCQGLNGVATTCLAIRQQSTFLYSSCGECPALVIIRYQRFFSERDLGFGKFSLQDLCSQYSKKLQVYQETQSFNETLRVCMVSSQGQGYLTLKVSSARTKMFLPARLQVMTKPGRFKNSQDTSFIFEKNCSFLKSMFAKL